MIPISAYYTVLLGWALIFWSIFEWWYGMLNLLSNYYGEAYCFIIRHRRPINFGNWVASRICFLTRQYQLNIPGTKTAGNMTSDLSAIVCYFIWNWSGDLLKNDSLMYIIPVSHYQFSFWMNRLSCLFKGDDAQQFCL